MFKNFRAFIRRNTPIIIRRKTLENMIISLINAMDKNNLSVINPAIRDLECLRKNTWDQDKITHIQNLLRSNLRYARKYSNDN